MSRCRNCGRSGRGRGGYRRRRRTVFGQLHFWGFWLVVVCGLMIWAKATGQG